jgi:uncharacterized protein YpmB
MNDLFQNKWFQRIVEITIYILVAAIILSVGFLIKASFQKVADNYSTTCKTEIAKSVELREVKVPQTFGGESTEYYIVFDNGKAAQISGGNVALYQDGQSYKLTQCRAQQYPFVERIER